MYFAGQRYIWFGRPHGIVLTHPKNHPTNSPIPTPPPLAHRSLKRTHAKNPRLTHIVRRSGSGK
ncbi:MAG: hypothetical protein AB7J40_00600 [Candidatus Altimarinota bacterium]